LKGSKRNSSDVSIDKEGKLGVGLGVKHSQPRKIRYYKVSKLEFGFMESIPVGVTRGTDQLVGYGKQLKMIFSPSTGAYKQVGVLKPYLIFSKHNTSQHGH
jgi:regulator of sigma E protease